MNIFSGITVSQHSWICLSDVEPEKIKLWNEVFTNSGLDVDHTRLQVRTSDMERQELIKENWLLISFTKEEAGPLAKTTSNPYLFILTDQNGMALDFIGSETAVNALESVNVGIGTSFALEHVGISGISLSMQMDSLAAVHGSEHSLQFFSKWSCICSPIKQGNQTYGYLNMSVAVTEDVSLIVPLLERIVTDIEASMLLTDPANKKAKIYEHFDLHCLTNREKEIGFCWLQNQSALQISLSLGISESTVRHTLKKVYSKTKCHDKGGFIRKFMN